MNFFAHQSKARSNTTKLVLLFALAIASLILITELFVLFISPLFTEIAPTELGGDSIVIIAGIVIAVVVVAWMYKSIQLAQGGKVIAEALDGKRIGINTQDADERKILNVVEEMAIASGIPVPPVYVMEEHGINAFAAGYSQRDAVIGITRGAIRALNRDELQGVVAHEFSHIFNGDMRLNIRLISVLHGILVVGMIGETLLEMPNRKKQGARESCFKNDSDTGGHGQISFYVLGVGLYIIGYLGYFFGSLIKAAVSREREFLADATAVQYTRNPEGIGNALRKIGGFPIGGFVSHPEGHEISHLFFANGIQKKFLNGLATHPPLKERIRRIDPSGSSQFIKVTLPEESKINPYLLKASREGIAIDPDAYKKMAPPKKLEPIEYLDAIITAVTPTTALEYAGVTTSQHIAEAQQILGEIPESFKALARDHYDVQALLYCLLLDKHRSDIHEQQLHYLKDQVPVDIYREVMRIKNSVAVLPPRFRLPLMDIAINTLKQLSQKQYLELKIHLMALIKADKTIELMEWSLYRMVVHHLEDKVASPIGYKSLPSLHLECQRLLSAIALSSSDEQGDALQSFQRGWSTLMLPAGTLISDALQNTAALDKALQRANQLHPLKKPLLIKACCASLHQQDDAEGIELIRIIVDSLDVPMPPLLNHQTLC